MKKIITIALLLVGFVTFAQKEVAKKVDQLVTQNTIFKPYTVLNATASISNKEINSVVKKASFAKINAQGLVNRALVLCCSTLFFLT